MKRFFYGLCFISGIDDPMLSWCNLGMYLNTETADCRKRRCKIKIFQKYHTHITSLKISQISYKHLGRFGYDISGTADSCHACLSALQLLLPMSLTAPSYQRAQTTMQRVSGWLLIPNGKTDEIRIWTGAQKISGFLNSAVRILCSLPQKQEWKLCPLYLSSH